MGALVECFSAHLELHNKTALRQTRCVGQRPYMIPEISLKRDHENSTSLDLLSISQTNAFTCLTYASENSVLHCINNAPLIAYKVVDKAWAITQANCHSWSCPKCGIARAKQEYWRIVKGTELHFITLTCRGRELSLEDSEANYLKWTNRLLTALRTRAKRKKQKWCYVQVTERQKRGHPHSHVITTFRPHDLYLGTKLQWKQHEGTRVSYDVDALRSDWLEKRCVSAGLGEQYDISVVKEASACSRYVAKYLFKPSMFTDLWPKKWRRVRYSQNFPKQERQKADGMPLRTPLDWYTLAKKAVIVSPQDKDAETAAIHNLKGHDVIVRRMKDAAIYS
ncbi:hypothetical protein LCGC14_1169460 [marine sediment metagenome]|uniref:Replication-associated protein ORF2/G2P domain-containing protein n=1 Tax=marine sediment metagenome TaxID=412755 RepID=A0A0F9MD91_9ZZZZ